ncbi:5-formyltetrahydrofolate cyclo-ligase [Sphingomonas aracearum]|nr:5-formyltetrahydrofolate cyclo-ligase [Sphingomonas aracearum]
MDKKALRARLRGLRDAFVAEHRPSLAAPAAFLRRLQPGLVIASYMPLGSEADPAPLVRAALAAGCTIALPHVVDRATPIRFVAWQQGAALVAGPFGLSQPGAEAGTVAPDIILTPLLGFDRAGNRLGQGAGHYDRAFVAHPDAWRVGLAWSVQEVPALPADPWDVPLHALLTEREWIALS